MKKPIVAFHRFFLAMVSAAFGSALFPGAARAAEAVSMAFQAKDGYYQIQSSFDVDADPSVVWNVLTDYDHITNFIDSMKESKVVERDGSGLYLSQRAEGGFLFFTQSARLLLYVQENPGQTITFQDMSGKDFNIYWGDWSLSPDGAGLIKVTYRLLAEPNFSAPFAGDIMRGSSLDLMNAIRREILKRQAGELRQVSSPTVPSQGSAGKL
jgi:hypothetical protein